MNIRGAQFGGSLQQIINRPHYRGAAGKVAEALDVFGGMRKLHRSLIGRAVFLLAQPFREHSSDVFKRRDIYLNGLPQHDLGRSYRGSVGGISRCQSEMAIGGSIRKNSSL